MPAANSGYTNLSVTLNAKDAIDQIVVALTVKYRRRFTVSEALITVSEALVQAVEVGQELEPVPGS